MRAGAPRTGVLGGTFDPPHLAHLVLAATARRVLGLDRVLLVPAGDPWRKADRAVTPPAERLRLVQAAAELLPWAEVSAIEIERAGASYSAQTMDALAALADGGGEWWFILGADALADLPHWHEPQRLIEQSRLAVAYRSGEPSVVSGDTVAALPGIAERVDVLPMPRLDISSSALRERIKAGRETGPLLPEAVRGVIDELGLYR